MATTTLDRRATAPADTPTTPRSIATAKLLAIVGILAIVVGLGSVLGGITGATYTYQQAAVENITTPGDAVIADAPVRGPLTMWSQSDIITKHQLDRTEGLRFSEMERLVPQIDEATGEPVVGEDGEIVMVANQERLSWIDATSLTTVLGVGIMAYALSAFAIVVGLTIAALGYALLRLRKGGIVLA